MALVLALKEGEVFYIEDVPVLVETVNHSYDFVLQVQKTSINCNHTITNKQYTEILPDVRVMAGTNKVNSSALVVKIAIEAPRNIKINREELYKKRT